MERLIVRYTGRVQGVGFRVTTHAVAQDFEVTGWVRNEPDRSVRLEAQGDPLELGRFLEAIEGRLDGFITGSPRSPMPTVEGETGFEIRR